jgi:hypothetical protein
VNDQSSQRQRVSSAAVATFAMEAPRAARLRRGRFGSLLYLQHVSLLGEPFARVLAVLVLGEVRPPMV